MTQPHDPTASPSNRFRRMAGIVVRWTLFLMVSAFVIRRGSELWRQSEIESVTVQPGWLLLAGGVYLLGWLPSLWLWKQLLTMTGTPVRFAEVARAYFGGHLAKYVPGKALVLVVRSGMIRRNGVPVATGVLTSAYESLVSMGAGALVALALAPNLLPEALSTQWPAFVRWLWGAPALFGLTVAVLGIALLPAVSGLFTRFSMNRTAAGGEGRIPPGGLKIGRLALAVVLIYAGWFLHGLSLGLTMRAVSDDPLHLADWPLWTAAVSLATVTGFVVLFAPGGLGVREGLLIEVLSAQPHIAAQTAVMASVLLRGVWLAAEILAAGTLYWAVPSKPAFGEPV